MRITALEEYGLRCMILLARNGDHTPLALPKMGEKEALSVPYSAKLMLLLRQGGLVEAVRGRHGGYMLAMPAERISLRSIFHALCGPVFSLRHCERYATGKKPRGRENCIHSVDCVVRDVWKAFLLVTDDMLSKATLLDLASSSEKNRLDFLEHSGIRLSDPGTEDIELDCH